METYIETFLSSLSNVCLNKGNSEYVLRKCQRNGKKTKYTDLIDDNVRKCENIGRHNILLVKNILQNIFIYCLLHFNTSYINYISSLSNMTSSKLSCEFYEREFLHNRKVTKFTINGALLI